ncbi:hypothetical protein LOTGIDRAFT_158347 [Lottia gigantea]|uniref:Uncharacterized protein n=1 Tax=Lottia gigantea TaxID=225164 RepID=V4A817_LOTGI|nr:hypothetical protein LOTGIDRAFT_158347 [Lottia gigantea]ESP00119.1 hypothetical protein LOTGIDRAFT_158347 [Lottia gigantea]
MSFWHHTVMSAGQSGGRRGPDLTLGPPFEKAWFNDFDSNRFSLLDQLESFIDDDFNDDYANDYNSFDLNNYYDDYENDYLVYKDCKYLNEPRINEHYTTYSFHDGGKAGKNYPARNGFDMLDAITKADVNRATTLQS